MAPRKTPSILDYAALSEAIADGVRDGNAVILKEITNQSAERQRLESQVLTSSTKVTELDKEVVLIKGVLMSLVGKGDGESGLVPRLERDMDELKTDMANVRGSVDGIHNRLGGLEGSLKTIMDAQAKQAEKQAEQAKQTSWSDGWRGVASFFLALAAVFAVIGGIVATVLWLANGRTTGPNFNREKVTYARPHQTLARI